MTGIIVGIDGSDHSRHALCAVHQGSGRPPRTARGFKRLLMGSVSTQVSHHAPCPVVVIPDETI